MHLSAPSDFTAQADTTVTLQPAETQQEVRVVIRDDNILEDSEEFTGLLSLPSGSAGVVLGTATTATATILDDDSKHY